MRIIRRLFVLLLVPLLASCDDGGFSPRALVGEWQFTTQTSNVLWRRDEINLSLGDGGAFVRIHNTYAEDGRPGDRLRAYTRVAGTYTVSGDSLVMELADVERWDILEPVPPPVTEPIVYAEERYRVRLVGDRLLLEEDVLVDGQPVTYYHSFRRVEGQ